jgi:(2R)-ethylmalonyl-CoA mutase
MEGGMRNDVAGLEALRARVEALTETLGRRPKLLIGKPGLDGHSSGAEQIAVRARDAGFEVVYQGIRLTPEALVRTAQEEDVNLVGLSVLSGSHLALVTEVIAGLEAAGLASVPVVVGGIIPPEDAEALRQAGAAAVYTPKNYDLNAILEEIVEIVGKAG